MYGEAYKETGQTARSKLMHWEGSRGEDVTSMTLSDVRNKHVTCRMTMEDLGELGRMRSQQDEACACRGVSGCSCEFRGNSAIIVSLQLGQNARLIGPVFKEVGEKD